MPQHLARACPPAVRVAAGGRHALPPSADDRKKNGSSSGGPWRRRRSGARSPAALQRLAVGGIAAHLAAILRFSAATRLPRGDVDCQKLCERSKADERVAPRWTKSLGCVTVRVPRHWPRALASMSPHVTRRQCCAVSAALRGCGPVTEARSLPNFLLIYSHFHSVTPLDGHNGGNLGGCDTCPAAWHVECLPDERRTAAQLPSNWSCPACATAAATPAA